MDDLDDRIRQAHTIADLDAQRALAWRTITQQIEMLELALHALRHGSPDVTDEYIDRAIAQFKSVQTKIGRG